MPREYKLSGELGEAGLKVPLGWFAATALPMALDGWVDAALGNYAGSGIITMLASVLVSGAAVGFLSRRSQCRSPEFLVKAGLIVAILSYGVNWAVFLSAQTELGSPGVFAYLLNPLNAFKGLRYMLFTESYTLFGWSPPAALRVVGWLLECLLWLGLGGLWAARNALSRKLFCESCASFAVSEEPTTFLSLTEDAEHRERLMRGEFLSQGLKVMRVGPTFPASFALCVQRCGCGKGLGLHIALRTVEKGRVKRQDVSPLYELNSVEQAKLQSIAKQKEWTGQSG